jgi:hypothetical protein
MGKTIYVVRLVRLQTDNFRLYLHKCIYEDTNVNVPVFMYKSIYERGGGTTLRGKIM